MFIIGEMLAILQGRHGQGLQVGGNGILTVMAP
jgi:hypothetical protein